MLQPAVMLLKWTTLLITPAELSDVTFFSDDHFSLISVGSITVHFLKCWNLSGGTLELKELSLFFIKFKFAAFISILKRYFLLHINLLF